MYKYEEIKQIHLEITSRCNATCPQCPRNISGGRLNPNLPITDLTLADITTIFPDDFIKQLDFIFLCGNYGDPMMARDTIEVLEYFRECNPEIRLAIHSNASGRPSSWWKRLARVVTYCRFSIDGLEDTNHIYRRGTDWDKIMESVAAYINAGGVAEWDFIVFHHNEHQVNRALELSQRLGFRKFFLKKTIRFYDSSTGSEVARQAVLDREGNIEYFIEPPHKREFHNESVSGLIQIVSNRDEYNAYLDQTCIECKALAVNRLYISAEGIAFPCCFTASIYQSNQSCGLGEIWRLIKQLPEGKDSINTKLHPIKEIVNGPFFQDYIPKLWGRNSIAEGKLETCSRVCGSYPLYSGQATTVLM